MRVALYGPETQAIKTKTSRESLLAPRSEEHHGEWTPLDHPKLVVWIGGWALVLVEGRWRTASLREIDTGNYRDFSTTEQPNP